MEVVIIFGPEVRIIIWQLFLYLHLMLSYLEEVWVFPALSLLEKEPLTYWT